MRSTTHFQLLLAGAAAVLAGCGTSGSKEQVVAAVQAATRDPMRIQAPPSLREQLKLGQPIWAEVSNTLRVAGQVETDETRLARVNSPVSGRITDLRVVEGEPVRKGQVLAMLSSVELSSAQLGFLKALSQKQLAQRAVERAGQLLEADVIGRAELQRREAELQQIEAELSSAQDQLRVLGMSDEALAKLEKSRTVDSFIPILATIDGIVMERKATIGQVLQPAETTFVLADLSHVWLVADVPAQAAANLAVGKVLEAELSALPEEKIRGRLTFVSSIVNPETRTVQTRMDLPNPRRQFKPAMLAVMLLKDRAERQRVVPAAAVVRESNQDFIFVQTGPDTFLLRPVTLGVETKDGRVVESGLRDGESIVLDGAFHLNNERKRQSLQGD
jgi:cobalt-zinc-cadmium efflux system membrane fusion protein